MAFVNLSKVKEAIATSTLHTNNSTSSEPQTNITMIALPHPQKRSPFIPQTTIALTTARLITNIDRPPPSQNPLALHPSQNALALPKFCARTLSFKNRSS